MLQQHLPLAVLKPQKYLQNELIHLRQVATAPTACGIETAGITIRHTKVSFLVATAPTACGIETNIFERHDNHASLVATAPTACGIETSEVVKQTRVVHASCNSTYRLRY